MKEIAKALAAAQAEMGKALKSATNPHFRSKYADLGAVMDACLPALNKNGIGVIHTVSTTDLGGQTVDTRFIHESGDELVCSVPLIIGKNDMQGLGSAMTYARRYGLMALAGIAPEDDDGNAAAASVARTANSASVGLQDAWMDGVLDSLPANASQAEKARAFAAQLCADFAAYKSAKGLEGAWDKRKKIIAGIEKADRDAFGRVVDAYETRMQALTGNDTPADYMTA